jgi:Secretion system C-terminal sorting domain
MYYFMMRKIILAFLLAVGAYCGVQAQIRDSITIYVPPFSDTTCYGAQVTFWATPTSDTFTGITYKWFVNGVYTGVSTDTFRTTATASGDTVHAVIYFTNSSGLADTFLSNDIVVYHAASIPPRAVIAIVSGNNPDCSSRWLTFGVTPANGGLNPVYQWFVNGVPVIDADSTFFGGLFADSAKVYCQMISNSPCAAFDTAISDTIMVIHDSLSSSIVINTRFDTVCHGRLDTFNAIANDYGSTAHYQWYVNTTAITGAIGTNFYSDSLHNGDSVYCILTSVDSCVRNHNQKSNTIFMVVDTFKATALTTAIISGANPGCLDSPLTLRAFYSNFGSNPTTTWYIDGVAVRTDTPLLDTVFANGQVVTYKVFGTDRSCRTQDTIVSGPIHMVRDSTPVSPWISLDGNLLVANNAGTYKWYGPNGMIPGATGQTFHPLVGGYYYAILDTGNCASGVSNTLYITLEAVQQMSMPVARIYPNPTTGLLVLDWGKESVTLDVAVSNMIGQVFMATHVADQSKLTLDLGVLPEGSYWVTFTNAAGVKVSRSIILAHR